MRCRIVTFYIQDYHQSELMEMHSQIVQRHLPANVDFCPWYLPMQKNRRGYPNHGENIDRAMRESSHDLTVVIEADAIPLRQGAFESLIEPASEGKLAGVAHLAEHLSKTEVYVSPGAFALRRDVYQRIGSPSSVATANADTAAVLTRECLRNGFPVKIYRPVSHEGPCWSVIRLPDGSPWGSGCTYENGIFHGFSKFPRTKLLDKYRNILKDLQE